MVGGINRADSGRGLGRERGGSKLLKQESSSAMVEISFLPNSVVEHWLLAKNSEEVMNALFSISVNNAESSANKVVEMLILFPRLFIF